jgi:predicted transcriptional regulator
MVRWNLISFIKRSSQRKKVLFALEKAPSTPSEIAKQTNMYLTHASRTLRELCSKKLVKCLTPKERVGKYYEITKLGKKVLSQIRRMEEE